MQAAGTVFSAYSQHQGGADQRRLTNFQADQLDYNAGQSKAAAQRNAFEERRKARLVSSRAQAVAAASGSGASDPTVLNIMGDITRQGEYNALTALYNGDVQAHDQRFAAQTRRASGAMAQSAADTQALSTVLSGAASLYDRYGDQGVPKKKTAGRKINSNTTVFDSSTSTLDRYG
jgi:hypothetical protein